MGNKMIYNSFFRKKSTLLYFIIFLIISILFVILSIAKKYYIGLGNEFYDDSYIKFSSPLKISFDEFEILNYNQTIEIDCNTTLTNVYISASNPIFTNEMGNKLVCQYNDYDIEYDLSGEGNIILNKNLYDLLEIDKDSYVYFIKLKNWFDADKVKFDIEKKYNTSVQVMEKQKDSNNYKYVIKIFEVFIFTLKLLFIVILVISVINIIIDEKKINYLYYTLGFNKIEIVKITIIKILLVVFIPIITFLASCSINFY